MSAAKCLLNGQMLTTWKAYKILLNWAKIIHIHYSVQFSCSVVLDSLRPHGLQHTRLPGPSPTPGAYSASYPSSQWCHPTISSSVVPFSSHLQSFPALSLFQLVLHIRWPKFWSFSFSISPSNEYSGLISFKIDWLDQYNNNYRLYLTIILGLEEHWRKRVTLRLIYIYYLLEKY